MDHKEFYNTKPGKSDRVDASRARAGIACCRGCSDDPDHDSKICVDDGSGATVWNLRNKCPGWVNGWNWDGKPRCEKSCSDAGMPYPDVGVAERQCDAGHWAASRVCAYPQDYVRKSVAEDICASQGAGMIICDIKTYFDDHPCGDEKAVWKPDTCEIAFAVNAFGKVALQTTDKTKQNYIRVGWNGGSFPLRNACTPITPVAANCRCAAEPLAKLSFLHSEYEICGLACLHTSTCVSFAVWSEDASKSKRSQSLLHGAMRSTPNRTLETNDTNLDLPGCVE